MTQRDVALRPPTLMAHCGRKLSMPATSTAPSATEIRVLVLGAENVGKSAVVVRYLTRRFISEYSSKTDLLYLHRLVLDQQLYTIEVLDTSRYMKDGFPEDRIEWADAFVVVYSIADKWSFHVAADYLRRIQEMKPSKLAPALLLGNKRDLEHSRQVGVDDGHELSLHFHCQFYEVSAADNHIGVSLALQSLLREARAGKVKRTLSVRRSLSIPALSKMIGAVFGKSLKSDRIRRPSLSL